MNSTNTQPYVYFVSYTHPTGSGNISFNLPRPITTWEQIQDITSVIKDRANTAWACVTTYQLLSGPTEPEIEVDVAANQLRSAISYGERFLADDGADIAMARNMVAFAQRALITLTTPDDNSGAVVQTVGTVERGATVIGVQRRGYHR